MNTNILRSFLVILSAGALLLGAACSSSTSTNTNSTTNVANQNTNTVTNSKTTGTFQTGPAQ